VPDGTYKLEMWDYEYSQPMYFEKTCIVTIKGKSIKIVGTNLKDEEFTESGLLLKHQKTGTWFIGQTESEQYLKEIPFEYAWIDFKLKRYCYY